MYFNFYIICCKALGYNDLQICFGLLQKFNGNVSLKLITLEDPPLYILLLFSFYVDFLNGKFFF